MAAASSRNVNVCAAIRAVDPSFGIVGSFLGSELFRDFDLSTRNINQLYKHTLSTIKKQTHKVQMKMLLNNVYK